MKTYVSLMTHLIESLGIQLAGQNGVAVFVNLFKIHVTSILQSPKDKGGFALPVFRYHYWAANVQKLPFWMREDQEPLPVWEHLENKASPFSLRSVLCAQLPLPMSCMANCPIVAVSLKIW